MNMNALFVDAYASGAGSGISWTNAFNNLQPALAAAEASGGSINSIYVARGTYMPDGGYKRPGGVFHPGTGDRNAFFELVDGVAVYGGFPSGGGSWADRDWRLHETFLSGDLDGDDPLVIDPADLMTESARSENSFAVVDAGDVGPAALLDGFIIRDGNAQEPKEVTAGGGMLAYPGSPIILNCTFTANTAGVSGGGALAVVDSSIELIDCDFVGNAATYGGAVVNGMDGRPAFTRCSFEANYADEGGAILNYNFAMFPIGVTPKLALQNCTFTGNISSVEGGALSNWGNSRALLANCLFVANGSTDGGGIHSAGVYLAVTNCTFSANMATGAGGGIYTNASAADILTNCILWGNGDASGNVLSAQIAGYGGSYPTPVVTYSCIKDDDGPGGSVPFGGASNHNIDQDPLFVLMGDPHLQAGSPCIDQGDNAVDIDPDTGEDDPLPGTDIDGDARVTDGNGDDVATVDMGADEVLWAGASGVAPGESETFNPGGGNDDPTEEAIVVFENDAGGGGPSADVSVTEIPSDVHQEESAYRALGTTLVIEVSGVPDGDFAMTVVIPFDGDSLAGQDPWSVKVRYYDTSIPNWVGACAGPCSEETTPPSLSELAARPVGDCGVYWSEADGEGFAWANVDHATDFAIAVLPGDLDDDGDVDLSDYELFEAAISGPGSPTSYPTADLDGDSDCDIVDVGMFAANYTGSL
jgi:hypothetical protein